jgi:hypothetical protein
MGRRATHKRPDPLKQRTDETYLQWQSRLAQLRDLEAASKQTNVTPEAMRHGDYHDGYTEVDGQRHAVKVNRGGSTIARWMNDPDAFEDGERAAIRYCQKMWGRIDYHGPALVVVDNGMDGWFEQEALTELAFFKLKLPGRYWGVFENICRFELPSTRRDDKTVVTFVAALIAQWKGL